MTHRISLSPRAPFGSAAFFVGGKAFTIGAEPIAVDEKTASAIVADAKAKKIPGLSAEHVVVEAPKAKPAAAPKAKVDA